MQVKLKSIVLCCMAISASYASPAALGSTIDSEKYFNHPEQYCAVEAKSVNCRTGDIVKILELPERATPEATHQVTEIVFKMGEVVDPVTGRRCRGTKFIDEEHRKISQQTFEDGSLLQ